jgi:transglutaminase-like putative cysteine protease
MPVLETDHFDYSHPVVRDFVAEHTRGAVTTTDRVVRLYYAVRDGLHYEVFDTDLTDAGLKASAIIAARRGFCLHKSIAYAAAVRSVGVPARLVHAHVTNHLASPELLELVGGDVFLHWYTEILLDRRWIKVTPVFSKLMCKLYGMTPLEFDGSADSVHQPATTDGTRNLRFLSAPQHLDDVDPGVIRGLIARSHPRMVTASGRTPAHGSLAAQRPVTAR